MEGFGIGVISACAVCDGAAPIFRNKPLVVIVGGDSAMEEANYLTMYGSKLPVGSQRQLPQLGVTSLQATDHVTLVNAYASYARKLKLEIARQLTIFEDMAKNIVDLTMKENYKTALFDTEGAVDEEILRQFEKEVKDKVKAARAMVAEAKESYDNQLKIQKLKDTIFAVSELFIKAKKNGNVIDVSVVVNSAVKNAEEPQKHVFHIVTDRMNVAAMKVWFRMRPVEGGAHVEVKAVEDFTFINSSYAPVLRQLEKANFQKYDSKNRGGNATNDEHNMGFRDSKYFSMLNHLRFYLPEMYPKLHQILLLDDDVVVQKDLTELWNIDMDGKVNGAVEICFRSSHRYSQYLNFSHPIIWEKLNPKACTWAYGMNIFDLDAWRRENPRISTTIAWRHTIMDDENGSFPGEINIVENGDKDADSGQSKFLPAEDAKLKELVALRTGISLRADQARAVA
ncbi:hypothetical protein QQ045_012465 [Rhodiola kirilowii]